MFGLSTVAMEVNSTVIFRMYGFQDCGYKTWWPPYTILSTFRVLKSFVDDT